MKPGFIRIPEAHWHPISPFFSLSRARRKTSEFTLLTRIGPDKLIASTNAVNDEPAALKIIKEILGDEIANLTLSLFPNEPVDNKNGTPTLESDVAAQ